MSDLSSYLETLNIKHRIIDHPPVFTVAESMEHLPEKFPVKNLLLKEEKGERLIFVICKGDERLDTKRIASELGTKKLQFAKPEILMDSLGVEPGSASLFSLLHAGSGGVEVVLDSRLLDQEELGFHPSLNTQTIFIAGRDVAQFLDAHGRTYHVYVP